MRVTFVGGGNRYYKKFNKQINQLEQEQTHLIIVPKVENLRSKVLYQKKQYLGSKVLNQNSIPTRGRFLI